MKYFLDTEFIEDGRTIDLLSIGIVAEDGREYYAQVIETDWNLANDWVVHNVLGSMQLCREGLTKADHALLAFNVPCIFKSKDVLRIQIAEFCDPKKYGNPQFWTYYGDYDWVALCQLFGTMMDLPEGWPMLAYDLRQTLDALGLQDWQQDDSNHNALSDARWIAETWEKPK